MQNKETWAVEQLAILENKTSALTEKERKALGADFIAGALQKVPVKINNQTELEIFQSETAQLISQIPLLNTTGRISDPVFSKLLSAYKASIRKKYKLVAKGYYMIMWMPLGVAISLSWGVALGNIALGIPLGIGIGMAIGAGLDRKAEKEGRVI
ncbi:hypothetical protein [Pedobacter metabolipauper]|uniref:Uncharacterized protein n=1 Tax=Pedobacter metabolipauper TaxID=425513 RepID=A0A4R6T066_9SPHI|nr:hypothetical protein [Pedobacter metabolipauper]TDQ11782.1 hypothetical protein ATK78_0910 [Pedobacter metabolipauper]